MYIKPFMLSGWKSRSIGWRGGGGRAVSVLLHHDFLNLHYRVTNFLLIEVWNLCFYIGWR